MDNPFERVQSPQAARPEVLGRDALLGDGIEARGPAQPPGIRPPVGFQGLQVDTIPLGCGWPQVWLLACHGGAGASTLGSLLGLRSVEGRRWPATTPPDPPAKVVLVSRTHAHGMAAFKQAATQWASGTLPNIELIGTALVDDAPRLPASMSRTFTEAKGLTPRLWHIRWHEAWRTLSPTTDTYPTDLRLRRTIAAIRKATTT